MKSTNNLIYATSKTVGKKSITVYIHLNDECKNGHQDFAITGDIYEAGKPNIDKYHIASGCIHDEIAKYFPRFIPFIRLHLCDWEGIPMHVTANGFYHLRNGFNQTKPQDADFTAQYCEYYRINSDQFSKLNEAKNEIQFALLLKGLQVFEQWKAEANQAIAFLEELTGQKFIADSIRSNFIAPKEEAIKQEMERQATGYYTPGAEAERAKQRQSVIISKLEAERDKDILKATTEFEVKKQVLLIGGEKALKNCIFYNHTNQLAFNWAGYDNISDDVVNNIISQIKLPEGVTIENKRK